MMGAVFFFIAVDQLSLFSKRVCFLCSRREKREKTKGGEASGGSQRGRHLYSV